VSPSNRLPFSSRRCHPGQRDFANGEVEIWDVSARRFLLAVCGPHGESSTRSRSAPRNSCGDGRQGCGRQTLGYLWWLPTTAVAGSDEGRPATARQSPPPPRRKAAALVQVRGQTSAPFPPAPSPPTGSRPGQISGNVSVPGREKLAHRRKRPGAGLRPYQGGKLWSQTFRLQSPPESAVGILERVRPGKIAV